MSTKSAVVLGCASSCILAVPAMAGDGAPSTSKADPLSGYAVCVTAAHAELSGRYSNPVEALVLARMACRNLRDALEEDVRKHAGASAPDILLAIDAEILNSLRRKGR